MQINRTRHLRLTLAHILRQQEGGRVTRLIRNKVDNPFHFRRIHKCALYTSRLAALREEQIATSNQLVGARRIENRTRVDHLHDTERHTSGEVRLDDTGNNIGRRTLCRDNHMDTHRTGLLGDTGDRGLNLFSGLHDQVAELVNDHHDKRHELMSLLRIQMS